MEIQPPRPRAGAPSLLNDAAILVAEDEPFVASDLALAIEDVGGEVVGPVASVSGALALLEKRPVVAAILDVNLTDRNISPVVEILLGLDIPIIVQTGVGRRPNWRLDFPSWLSASSRAWRRRWSNKMATLISGSHTPVAA